MDSPSQTNEGTPNGFLQPQSTWGDFNISSFVILQWLSKMQTATLVRVVNCTNSGGVAPVGFVDILPLVNQIDGQGNSTPHTTIFNVPYFRAQGGANAVIIDPQPGDIGMAVFASRDISKVKSTRNQANPGSFRQYSFSDAMYIGGLLNVVPTQYVQFSNAGINVVSPSAINLKAPNINIHASVSLKYDANGNGTEFTSDTRTDYVIGSTGSSENLNPPQIP